MRVSFDKLRNREVVIVSKPFAGIDEAIVEVFHHEIYRAAMGIANETTITILSAIKSQRWIGIVVKGTKSAMVRDCESQGLSDLLDRQVLKLLNIDLAKHGYTCF